MILCPRWWHFSAQRCTHNSPAAIHRHRFSCWVYRFVEGCKSLGPRARGMIRKAKMIQLFLGGANLLDSSQARIKKSLRSSIVKVAEAYSKPRQPYEGGFGCCSMGCLPCSFSWRCCSWYNTWPSLQTMHCRAAQWQDHANFLWSMVALTAAERRVAADCFKQSHLMMDVLHLFGFVITTFQNLMVTFYWNLGLGSFVAEHVPAWFWCVLIIFD